MAGEEVRCGGMGFRTGSGSSIRVAGSSGSGRVLFVKGFSIPHQGQAWVFSGRSASQFLHFIIASSVSQQAVKSIS
jgi:hypothetical protein